MLFREVEKVPSGRRNNVAAYYGIDNIGLGLSVTEEI